MKTGTITNIQKFCLHDGPGLRTTVFLKGCPLQCKWCHNPEMISAKPELYINHKQCIHCDTCITVCPENSSEQPLRCKSCGTCVEACPTGARRITGKKISVTRLIQQISREQIFYDESGGGVTFSGGEPMQQAEFLLKVLQVCRNKCIHTAVDTCGYVSFDKLEKIASVTDLFLYDLKLMDTKKHWQWTGVTNTLILENLEKLNRIHHALWIRIPIIPGVNNTQQEMKAMAQFISTLSGIKQVNLLPYHSTGVYKQKNNEGDWLISKKSLSKTDLKSLADPFISFGLNVIPGG